MPSPEDGTAVVVARRSGAECASSGVLPSVREARLLAQNKALPY